MTYQPTPEMREALHKAMSKELYGCGFVVWEDEELDALIAAVAPLIVAREREECAKIAGDIAANRVATERAKGFGPHSATQAANAYWCEEIEAAIRARKP